MTIQYVTAIIHNELMVMIPADLICFQIETNTYILTLIYLHTKYIKLDFSVRFNTQADTINSLRDSFFKMPQCFHAQFFNRIFHKKFSRTAFFIYNNCEHMITGCT